MNRDDARKRRRLRRSGDSTVKRRDLIRYLMNHGCELIREGGNHSWWGNLANGQRSAVPHHNEISDHLAPPATASHMSFESVQITAALRPLSPIEIQSPGRYWARASGTHPSNVGKH